MIAGSLSFNEVPAGPAPRRRWMWIIIGLLVGHTALMLTFVFIATHDRNFSVDSDYYGKAVRWDQEQAKRRASDQLGWKLQWQPIGLADAAGQRMVSFELLDHAGQPLNHPKAELTFFHRAHGQEVRVCPLLPSEKDPKRFEGALMMPHAGMWEIHLVVRAGGQEFIKDEVVEVP